MEPTLSVREDGELLKPYSGSIAEHLASVHSKLIDMRRAEHALTEALTATSVDLREMLWECAIVRYARPFANGVLHRPDDDQVQKYLTSSGDLYAAHCYILSLRNKHVAHSVNPMELAEPFIVLADPATGGGRRLIGVKSLNARSQPPELKDVRAFLQLAATMVKWFDDNHRHFRRLALKEVAAWPVDDLYAMPEVEITTTSDSTTALKPRLQFPRRSKKSRAG